MSDLFDVGAHKITVRFKSLTTYGDHTRIAIRSGYEAFIPNCPNRLIQAISLTDQAAADKIMLGPEDYTVDFCWDLAPGAESDITFSFNMTQSAFLYLILQKGGSTEWSTILSGATFIGDKFRPDGNMVGSVWRLAPDFAAAPTPTPTPAPLPSTGPVIQECAFPTLQWNLILVLSDLVEWIGCILHNIITILQWVVDWFLHFPDHLDAWASRLFGIDPALPFWDELEKKLIKMLISAAQQIIDILFADSDYWKGKKYQR